jgi:hypothetical protein
MKCFDDCLDENEVRTVTPDTSKAKSLTSTADARIEFISKINPKNEID